MSENWAAVQADVQAALLEVGFGIVLEKATSSGPEYDPTPGTPVEYDMTVIDDQIRIRDAAGNLTGLTQRVLTVAYGAVVPAKGDWLVVRGGRHRIGEVMPLAPGGIDLLYDLLLEA